MPEKAVISNLLKSYRRDPPRKQAEFAKEIKISRKQLSCLELREADPSMRTLQKIADYGGLSLAELLWTDDKTPCPPSGTLAPEAVMASRVKAFRTGEGASQERFAERVGISVSLLIRIEHGLAAPCLDVLQALAHHMGITVSELFIPDPEEGGM